MGIPAFIHAKSVCHSFKIYFYLCLLHICAGTHSGQKRVRIPWSQSYRLLWVIWPGCWEPNSSPLKGQQVFLTPELAPEPYQPSYWCAYVISTGCSYWEAWIWVHSIPPHRAVLSTLKVSILFVCFLTIAPFSRCFSWLLQRLQHWFPVNLKKKSTFGHLEWGVETWGSPTETLIAEE